jgi:thioredoxin-like negative regulator of GroEL
MTEAAMELVDEEIHDSQKKHSDYSKEEYNEALKVKLPVMVAKVDCVVHKDLCFQQQIWAYPTLRLFINGFPAADYKGDRTVLEMVHWLAHVEEQHKTQIGEDQFNVLLADESKYSII